MSIQATLQVDPRDFREELEQNDQGWFGLRTYRVNTIKTDEAIFAIGLPTRGDAWGSPRPELANLTVHRRATELIGGIDSGDGTGGWTKVSVFYQTPVATPIRIPTSPTQRWTDITTGRAQFQMFKSFGTVDIDATTLEVQGAENPVAAIIQNGQGAPAEIGLIEARVYTFQPLGASLDLATMNYLMRPSKLNDRNIQLPPLFGDSIPINLSQGRARYAGYELNVVNDLRQVVHVLELAEDFYFRWAYLNQQGVPQAWEGDRIYAFADFTGLW